MAFTDHRAAERLKNHDPEALNWLIDTYSKDVYSLCNRIMQSTCSSEDVEECVSDVFLDAWNRIDTFDSDRSSLKTWLLILTKYKSLDYRRKLMRKPAFEHLGMEPPGKDDTELFLLQKEALLQLLNAIQSLNQLNRHIFYKRYFYYATIEEIASSLDMSVKAIEGRLSRSRQHIRRLVDLELKEEPL
jgi:RNA polymerase sigma-70 factor, ECF subfamily